MANPYVGPRPFRMSEAAIFFGRDKEAQALRRMTATLPVVVAHGRSGTGKSSLLNAGLGPRLHADDRQIPVFLRPDLDMLTRVRSALTADGWTDAPVGDLTTLLHNHWLDRDRRPVLIFDQFDGGNGDIEDLYNSITQVVDRELDVACFLLCVDDENLGRIEPLLDRVPSLSEVIHHVPRLGRPALELAILGPLSTGPEAIDADPALVTEVLDDLEESAGQRDDAIDPGHLQIVWSALWAEAAARGRQTIGSSLYRDLGGARRIIRNHAGQLVRSLPFAQVEALRRQVGHIALPEGATIRLPLDDLVDLLRPPNRLETHRVDAVTAEVAWSVWFPVGRENFFSPLSDWRLIADSSGVCRSDRLNQPHYIPYLRATVLRRLLEVLPGSFGYDIDGVCEFSNEPDLSARPVSLTMLLDLRSRAGIPEAKEDIVRLRAAGVDRVLLRVDEDGFYTFVASTIDGAPTDAARAALHEHAITVFGGHFEVDWFAGRSAEMSEGYGAVRRYNGLAPLASRSDRTLSYAEEQQISPPLGALTFVQLRIVLDALCNPSLLPAVYFDQHDRVRRWLAENQGQTLIISQLRDFVAQVAIPVNARTPVGRAGALHRFLSTSAGTTLQWLRRSVESARLSLLDRDTREQRQLATGIDYEWTPDLVEVTGESEMRGYVMLFATRLPLLESIAEGARAAVTNTMLATEASREGAWVSDLQRELDQWVRQLDRLREAFAELDEAVSQSWQEQLLHELEHVRSEQEAMAEIERGHRGAGGGQRVGLATYAGLLTFLTTGVLIAGFIAAATGGGPVDLAFAFGVGIALIVLTGLGTRILRLNPPSRYAYEFSFRLDEDSSAARVRDYLSAPAARRLRLAEFRPIRLRPMGTLRTERISANTEMVKIHTAATVPMRRRPARFEVVVEILIRGGGDRPRYHLRHCRVVGVSPRHIELDRLRTLVGELVAATCGPLTLDGHLERDRLTALTNELYSSPRVPPRRNLIPRADQTSEGVGPWR